MRKYNCLHQCNPLDELAAYPAGFIDDGRKALENHKFSKIYGIERYWKTVVSIRKNHL